MHKRLQFVIPWVAATLVLGGVGLISWARGSGQSSGLEGPVSSVRAFALRLLPGEDLRVRLEELASRQSWDAAVVLTCVGSLRKVSLRFADREETSELTGKYEITSLVGTLSRHGSHLHLCVADEEGRSFGGHLKEGCLIHTTAELVVGLLPELEFRREPDARTGYTELFIHAAAATAP